MKEAILSNAEKAFVLRAISEGQRLDGRNMNECRKLQIIFGTDWGCCQVSLGGTKVLAQVTCEVQQPKATRPNEGLLFLNVELSPMGAPHFEAGRQSELGVQLNRLLEKCIKDSRCVDLESLCIVAEEKVWAIRVDINVLNHEGNLVDAASVAALAALCHFRHPDVTMEGEQVVIHQLSERDPIPLSLHHHPVCVTYAIFSAGEHVIADPTVLEERVSESQLVFGVNAYRELCGLHLGGSALSDSAIIVQCGSKAANRAVQVVQAIKTALEEDNNARAAEKPVGFAESTKSGKMLSLLRDRLVIQLNSYRLRHEATSLVRQENDESTDHSSEEAQVVPTCKGSAELIPKLKDVKKPAEESEEEMATIKVEADSEDNLSDIEVIKEVSFEERIKVVDSIVLSGDSEEEETVELRSEDLEEKNKKKKKKSKKNANDRGWYPNQQW